MNCAVGKKRFAQVGKKGLLALIAAVLTLASMEAAARGYLKICPPQGHVERWAFRSQRPPAYQAATYFSKDFLHESMTCLRDFVNPANTNFSVPGEYSGHLIHVSDGCRTTEFQPKAGKNRMLLFGGSTVFCAEVPDSETIASHLQLLIDGSAGPPLTVENYGVPSMNAVQQLGRLETLTLRPGDVVIFYDGVNDVYYPVYNGNPRGWLPGDGHDGGVRKLSLVQRAMHEAFIRYGDQSGLVRLLFNVQQRTLPHTVVDEQTLEQNVGEAETGYRTALAAAQAFARQSGATFVHFVQPHIFTLPRHSPHEKWLIENELKNLPGLDRAFMIAYPRLQRAAAEGCGSSNFDIADVLDARDGETEIYLDFCHVNHVANRTIARRIFDAAFASRSRPAPPARVVSDDATIGRSRGRSRQSREY